MARSFSPWSHMVCMLFAQLTHAIGLNDVCDALRLHSGPLSALRGASAPSRNNLSHANKHRDAALAERLFWSVLEHLQKLSPGFAAGRRGKGLARRFRRVIHVVDSSTIALIASCIDWAQHRRRKAAAKLHVRLDLHSLLLCSPIREGWRLSEPSGWRSSKAAYFAAGDTRVGSTPHCSNVVDQVPGCKTSRSWKKSSSALSK